MDQPVVDLEKKIQRLNGLVEAGTLINSSLDRGQVLERITEKVGQLLGCEAVSVILLDERRDELVIEISPNLEIERFPDREGLRFPKNQGIAGWVVTNGEIANVPDVEQDNRHYKLIDQTTGFVTRSILAAPLRIEGRVVGVLQALNRTDGNAFISEDEELIGAVSNFVAVGVKNARSHTEAIELSTALQRRMDELSRLQEVGRTLVTALDVEKTIESALSAVVQLLGFDRAWLVQVDQERQVLGNGRIVGGTVHDASFLRHWQRPLTDEMSIQVRCAVTNQPVLIDDVAKSDIVLDRTAIGHLNIQAFVAVPLRSDDVPLGVMAADRSQSGRSVGFGDLETLQRFADQVTLALEIAQLHEEMVEQERMDLELATAHKIQMSLMPSSSPEVEGFDIAGTCEPASEVGGDYFSYEWLDAEKTQLGILAADVSGKGMQAAGITIRLNEMFFYEARTNRYPSKILSGLHRSLHGRIESHMFATAFMAVLDVQTGKVTMANAGHPSPMSAQRMVRSISCHMTAYRSVSRWFLPKHPIWMRS